MSTPAVWALRAACCDLVQQGADAVDAGHAEAFAALFTPDGSLQRPDGTVLQGRAAIAAAYAARDPDRLTQHLVCNQHVDLDAQATSATVHSKVLLWSGRHSSPLTPQGRAADGLSQVGEFVDALVLTPEGWRIRHREARFILFRREA